MYNENQEQEMENQMRNDILRRLTAVETRIEKLENQIVQYGIVDATLTAELKSLKTDFTNLKAEVLEVIKNQTEKIWDLIYKSWKLIMLLVTIIIALVGVKLAPEILKAITM